jgi:hypothetical protein
VSGGPFEGEITMNIARPDGPPIGITFEISGSKVRFTQSPPIGRSSYSIVDYGTKKIVTVFDAKKLVIPMELYDLNGVVAGVAKKHPGTATATGKTSVVAGYSCDVYRATEENGDTHDACLAKGVRVPLLGASLQFIASTFSGDGDWVPMRNVTTDKTGKEKSHMEVTKVDRKAVDDSRFVAPAGYKTETFQEMETGLQAR